MEVAEKLFVLAQKCNKLHLGVLRKFFELILRYFCGIEISAQMAVGGGLRLPHNGLGVVIHPKVVLGQNVKILQNVTIGGREGSGLPIIGDNVEIGAGAVLLGDIVIGNNVKIGANAVVLQSVPDNAIAVGVPAVIKERREN